MTDGNFNVTEYAKSLIESKGTLRGLQSSISNTTPDRVSTMLDNVLSNHDTISATMESLAQKDGVVRSILKYLSTSLTLNHNIYPSYDLKSEKAPQIDLNEYLVVASELEKYNLGFFLPYFIFRTLIKGVSYFYEIKDSTGVAYLEFPNNMCRVSYLENGIYRWMIDVSKIKTELLNNPAFPSEIKKAIENSDRSDTKKWVEGKYLLLSDKAIAFTFDMGVLTQGGVAVSELVSLLPNALLLDTLKKNINVKDDLDTVRIIHGKIPSDKEGKLKMSSQDAGQFQTLLASSLPDGVAVSVTPFELENISLNGAGTTKAFDNVKDALKQVLKSGGYSPQMFGDDTNSSNAIKLSITRDMSWLYKVVLPVFTNYYNFVLSKIKTSSNSNWRIKILEQSIFTLKEDIQSYKEAITLGGSRTDYLASIGMTPIEIYMKLHMEQNILNIDALMKPKEVSYTMSGSSNGGSGTVGRPKTDNPTDDTERLADAE